MPAHLAAPAATGPDTTDCFFPRGGAESAPGTLPEPSIVVTYGTATGTCRKFRDFNGRGVPSAGRHSWDRFLGLITFTFHE
jgi:hypothetical protein